MVRIFLTPRSNETSHKHFKSTIKHGIEDKRKKQAFGYSSILD